MYLFECEATFEADPDAVWKAWTDVARWPEWDVSKEIARLDGPFQPVPLENRILALACAFSVFRQLARTR